MAGLFGAFSMKGIGSSVMSGLYGLMFIIPIILVVVFVIMHIKNKNLYKFNVRVYRIRANGKVKESNFKGGYIGRKGSAPFFRIKTGKFWWGYVDLTTTPDPAYMDEDDRVHYLQIDINNYIQMQKEPLTELNNSIASQIKKAIASFKQPKKEISPNKLLVQIQKNVETFLKDKDGNEIKLTPVESDIKYSAILSIQRIKEVLRTEPTWKKILPYFGLILLAIVFIIAYALLMDTCGG